MTNQKYTFLVEGMSCGHCKSAVEKAVRVLSGIARAEVNLPTNTLVVEFDASKITLEEIKESVIEEGYGICDNQ